MKKFIALLLAMVMVLSLAACSVEKTEAPAPTEAPKAEAPAATEAPKAEEPAAPAVASEITLWTYPIGKWSDQETIERLLGQFKEATGITVNYEFVTYADGDAKIDTAIEGGVAPDLVMEGPERLVANWGAKGKMVNIADLFDDEDKAQIFDGPEAACFADANTAYEYPLCMIAHCMAINKTVFEAADAMQYIDVESRTWTTENFIKAMDAVYAYTGKQVGAVYCNSQAGDQGSRALINNMYGGTFTNAEHTDYTWADDANVKALEYIYATDAIEIDPALTASDEIAMFYNGTLNVSFCWNAGQQSNPNSANTGAGLTANGDEIMYVCFPCENGTDVQLCGGIWGFGIFDNGDAGKIEAAKTFIKYFCDSEATVEAVKESSFFAVRDVAGEGTDMASLWDGNDLMLEYSSCMMPKLGDYYNVISTWTSARAAWWNALQQVEASDGSAEAIKTAMEDGMKAAVAG